MPRAICRCGETLTISGDAPERIVCPRCGARIRVRRDPPRLGPGDGFLRFPCPCGRRLKVKVGAGGAMPEAGKCPDCGRVVPVPTSQTALATLPAGSPVETPTSEMSAEEIARLERWAARFRPAGTVTTASAPPAVAAAREALPAETEAMPAAEVGYKSEAGLRVCPRCKKPLHLSAESCRECGAAVPRR